MFSFRFLIIFFSFRSTFSPSNYNFGSLAALLQSFITKYVLFLWVFQLQRYNQMFFKAGRFFILVSFPSHRPEEAGFDKTPANLSSFHLQQLIIIRFLFFEGIFGTGLTKQLQVLTLKPIILTKVPLFPF